MNAAAVVSAKKKTNERKCERKHVLWNWIENSLLKIVQQQQPNKENKKRKK